MHLDRPIRKFQYMNVPSTPAYNIYIYLECVRYSYSYHRSNFLGGKFFFGLLEKAMFATVYIFALG